MTRRITITLTLLCVVYTAAWSQSRFIDRAGHASFFSKAPLENIEAHTNQALSLIDLASGEIAVTLLMKSFQFEKALMQEHFNEKYVESDKYPKASFKGKIVDLPTIDLTKDGSYTVEVNGEIALHGETKPLNTTAQLMVKDGALAGSSTFKLKVKDFKIEIPSVVVQNIAEEVDVKVSFNYKPSK